jgi:hypothetical protein
MRAERALPMRDLAVTVEALVWRFGSLFNLRAGWCVLRV